MHRNIDLSRDGSDNDSFGAKRALHLITLNGITANALAVFGNESTPESQYRDTVIRGANPFSELAEDHAALPGINCWAKSRGYQYQQASLNGRKTSPFGDLNGCFGAPVLAESGL